MHSLLIVSSQYDVSSEKLQEILHKHQVNSKTSNQLTEAYEKIKFNLQTLLQKYSAHTLPMLTDADIEIQHWEGNFMFKVTLKGFNASDNRSSVIHDFYCNGEELQLLITKLKDMETHCTKISKFE